MNWSLFRLDLDIEHRTECAERIKLMMNLDYIFSMHKLYFIPFY